MTPLRSLCRHAWLAPLGGPIFVSPPDQFSLSPDTVLLEQDEHWQLEGRRMFSAESMAAIPSLEELPTQPSLQDATA